jgi:hypothetical protein
MTTIDDQHADEPQANEAASATVTEPTVQPAHAESDSSQAGGFLSLLEGVLFAPRATMSALPAHQWPPALMGVAWLIVVTVVVTLGQYIWKGDEVSTFWLSVDAVWASMGSVLAVLLLSAVIRGFGGVFNKPGSYRRLVGLLSLSTLPWLLYGPLAILKISLPFMGEMVAFFIGLGLWFWQLVLFAMALSESFQISFSRAVLFMLLPVGMTWWLFFATGQLFEIFIGRLLP